MHGTLGKWSVRKVIKNFRNAVFFMKFHVIIFLENKLLCFMRSSFLQIAYN